MNARARKDASKRNPKTFECGDEATLDAFHAGNLSKKLHNQVEKHLTTCATCREIAADFELCTSIAGLLREAREDVPSSLRERLIETTTALGKKDAPKPPPAEGGAS